MVGIAIVRPHKEPTGTIQDDPVVAELKTKYSTVFVDGLPPERTTTNITEHEIPLKPGTEPICQPLRRMAPKLLVELRNQLDELFQKGFIRTSSTGAPYGQLLVLMKPFWSNSSS